MTEDLVTGDYIVDCAYIYEVTSVTPIGTVNYKPVWGSDKVFTASIPAKNLAKTGLRKVLTPNESKEVIDGLRGPAADYEYTTQLAKEEVYQNRCPGVARVLKHLWANKTELGKIDRELMEQIVFHLSHEISFATKRSYQTVRKEIETRLG